VVREFSKATVVFEGEVESFEARPSETPAPVVDSTVSFTFFGQVRFYSFRTLRVHKGPSQSRFIVLTGGGGGDCGCDFQVGKTYLVYAYGSPGRQLFTSICTRTQPVEDAAVDLRYLNGEPPIEEDFLTPKDLLRRSTGTLCGRVLRPDTSRLVDVAIYLWKADTPYEKEAWFERPEPSGAFCIEFVEPGRYELSAVDRTKHGPARYVGLYGTDLDVRTGAIVEARPGKTTTGLDIRLQPQQVHNVYGHVMIEDGARVKFKHVEIKASHSPDTPFAFLDYIEPRPDGTFVIPRVPRGHVRLQTYMSEFADKRWATTETDLLVDGDKKDVVIVLKRKDSSKD